MADVRYQNRQADGYFGGGHGHDHKDENLPFEIAPLAGERDEGQISRC